MSSQGNNNGKRGPKSKRAQAQYVIGDDHATDLLLCLMIGAAYAGGAVRIGLTRDGGALSIGIYAGDEYGVEYVRPGEDLAAEVRNIAEGWQLPLAAYDADQGVWILP
jgi:hypothetical protein